MASGGGTLRVKLCDVGNGKAALSTITRCVGAPFYQAPEVFGVSPYTACEDRRVQLRHGAGRAGGGGAACVGLFSERDGDDDVRGEPLRSCG
jgi:serine/threonine protein kinase